MLTVDYLLNKHPAFDDLERTDLELFRRFVSEYGYKIYDRTAGRPVITASAVVVNPDFSKILLMHHKLHGSYRQFGGHADGNPDLVAVSAGELADESNNDSGILLLQYPIDIIRWDFPEDEKHGPAHDCFDIAFLFMMSEDAKLKPKKSEVKDIIWEWLKVWRNYENSKAIDPQKEGIYQHRICDKIELFNAQR